MNKRRIAAVAASVLALSVISMSTLPVMASAPPTPVNPGNYTPVKGTTTTAFDKYLVMDEGANVPNTTFEYTIRAGDERIYSLDNKTIQVYPGPTPSSIVLSGTDVTDPADTTTGTNDFTVAFKQADTASAVLFASKPDTDYVKNLTDGEKYVKKTITLSFANVEFDEPGVYRYIITEENTAAQGITYDSDSTRVLDVYVEDDGGTLKVSNYVLHATDATITMNDTTYGSDGEVITGSTTETPADETSDYKSQGFTNDYSSYDLTFSKAVTGNQASKDKYFKFTLKIENAVAGTQFDVSYSEPSTGASDNLNYGNADQVIKVGADGKPNRATTVISAETTQPPTLTVGSDGTVTQEFYLHHGQNIVVRGLALGTTYTIKENPEDYTPTGSVTGDTKTGDSATETGSDITFDVATYSLSDTYIKDDAVAAFTNKRQGAIPTGVLLSVAAPAGIGAAVLGGIIFLAVKRSKKDDEDEEE